MTAIAPAHLPKKFINSPGEDSPERIVPKPADVVKTFGHLGPTYQAFFFAGAATGLRRGKLLGLRWTDIDLEAGAPAVRHDLQHVKKARLGEDAHKIVERVGTSGPALLKPKSKRSVRNMEIPPKLADMLRELRRRQTAASPFVFQDEIGRPLDPDAIYDALHDAQDRAGIRRFGLHGLRHFYRSLLQESGASLKHAQERMGHASATTTMETCMRVVKEEGRKFAEKVKAYHQRNLYLSRIPLSKHSCR